MSTMFYNENNWKKNIACLLTSQAVSMIGTRVVQYAIIWHVTIATQSGTMIGLMSCIGILPMVLVMPVAGALADHYNRKKIALLSDGCIAIVSFFLALALFVNSDLEKNTLLFLGVTFIRSIGEGFQTPAVSAIIPQVTPKEYLVRINGTDQTIQAIMMLASPALSASLLVLFPLSGILLLDFITAAIGIALFCKVKIPPIKPSTEKPIKLYDQIKSGMSYLNTRKILMTLIFIGFMGSVFTTPASNLAPLQVTRRFHEGLWQLSAIEIGFAIGMIVGGSSMVTLFKAKNQIKTIALGYSLLILPFILLGVTSNFWLYLAMMAAIGFIVPISRTAMVSFFQSQTEENYMGRVMSIVTMTISLASPATMLILGPLSDTIPIGWIMIASGVMLLPFAIWIYCKSIRG